MAETLPAEKIGEIATEQQQSTAVNGESAAADLPANSTNVDANGEAGKANKVQEVVKEPPKNPQEDPIGWVNQQTKAAIHKVNYLLLTWIQGLSAEQAATQIQGREPGYVTRGQFLDYLRDGSLLAALANRLQPESIQKIFVGEELKEKANQKANIEAFLQFAKEKAGMESDQLFELKDLQEKGKTSYQAVLNTLFRLGLISADKFTQDRALDILTIEKEAAQATESNLLQNLLHILVNRANPSALRKSISSLFGNFGQAQGTSTDAPADQGKKEGGQEQEGTSETAQKSAEGNKEAKPEETKAEQSKLTST